MGNTIKLVSGFILFVIGILIAYETSVYNLLELLFIVGFIISIVGIVLIISYFVDYNADRTTNMLKDFLNSNEFKPNSLNRFEGKLGKKNSNGPLNAKRDYDSSYDDLVLDDYDDRGFDTSQFIRDDYVDDSKAVLNVVSPKESTVSFDKQLDFKPRYDRPLEVTRAPKKRSDSYFNEEIPAFDETQDKSEDIITVLSQEPEIEEPAPVIAEVPADAPARDIKIDINNPESLPIPKSLQSYVISQDGLVSSQEAFDQLAINVHKEIMLEIPSLNDLSDRFLSHVPTIYSRVIIDEFDISDMSYMFLISSLIKQGVHIKTVPKVHTVNLITDDSHAMIISEGQSEFEYGAIYEDRTSISNIRANFEKTWNIASNLDESIIVNAMGGAA